MVDSERHNGTGSLSRSGWLKPRRARALFDSTKLFDFEDAEHAHAMVNLDLICTGPIRPAGPDTAVF